VQLPLRYIFLDRIDNTGKFVRIAVQMTVASELGMVKCAGLHDVTRVALNLKGSAAFLFDNSNSNSWKARFYFSPHLLRPSHASSAAVRDEDACRRFNFHCRFRRLFRGDRAGRFLGFDDSRRCTGRADFAWHGASAKHDS
jgi:hypothetical protein